MPTERPPGQAASGSVPVRDQDGACGATSFRAARRCAGLRPGALGVVLAGASLAVHAAEPVGLVHAAPPARATRPRALAPAPSLPPATLVVTLRWRNEAGPPATGDGPRWSTQASDAAPDPADAGRNWRTTSALTATAAWPQWRVRSGEWVRMATTRERSRETFEWIWTAQGQGLVGSTRWQADLATLALQPSWPGGARPVDLRWRLQGPPDHRAAYPPADTLAMEGRVDVALGDWTELARWPADAAASATSAAPARVLEVRVSRP